MLTSLGVNFGRASLGGALKLEETRPKNLREKVRWKNSPKNMWAILPKFARPKLEKKVTIWRLFIEAKFRTEFP